MELQLTPEAEKRILDIATEAREQIFQQVDELLVDYPEHHIISKELARSIMLDKARTNLLHRKKWVS